MPFTVDYDRERERFAERPTFREVLLHILMEKGGDFRSASFGFDTAITFTRFKLKGNRTVRISKTYELAAFPSVKDLVDENATIFSQED